MCRDCGDPQAQHKGGTGGCRHCELGCARFVPETPVLVEPELIRLDCDADVCGFYTQVPEKLQLHKDSHTSSARRELALAEASLKAMTDDLNMVQADLAEARADQGEIVTQYDAHQCLTCSARYIPDTAAAAGHDHPLTRVRVTVTRLGGAV